MSKDVHATMPIRRGGDDRLFAKGQELRVVTHYTIKLRAAELELEKAKQRARDAGCLNWQITDAAERGKYMQQAAVDRAKAEPQAPTDAINEYYVSIRDEATLCGSMVTVHAEPRATIREVVEELFKSLDRKYPVPPCPEQHRLTISVEYVSTRPRSEIPCSARPVGSASMDELPRVDRS